MLAKSEKAAEACQPGKLSSKPYDKLEDMKTQSKSRKKAKMVSIMVNKRQMETNRKINQT